LTFGVFSVAGCSEIGAVGMRDARLRSGAERNEVRLK
jgi:hypothetical protein